VWWRHKNNSFIKLQGGNFTWVGIISIDLRRLLEYSKVLRALDALANILLYCFDDLMILFKL
jgi:hypothetical protein